MVGTRNKLQKFLEKKETLITESNKYTNTTSTKKEFLPFFAPNKMFVGRDEVTVRILPNKESFYMEYMKHFYKVGETYKQFVCPNSTDENGIAFGYDCPLCKFLAENKESIDNRTVWWPLSAKKSHIMFIYNPHAKQIQRYEANDYGMIDITRALLTVFEETNDSFDPDVEGFDITFRKDNKGYAKVVKASVPERSVEDILIEATNARIALDDSGQIKSFMDELCAFSKDTSIKFINANTVLAMKYYAPTFNSDDYIVHYESSSDTSEMPLKNVIEDDEEEVIVSKKKNIISDVDDEEDDDTVDDIKAFLAKRKKA